MQRAAARSISLRYVGAILGVLIVVLGILDVISTNLVIAAGGVELNPIVAWIMERFDSWWHMPKLFVHIVAGLLVFYLLNNRFTATIAFLLVFLYGIVIHHNLALLYSV
jgi:hypothetical protein